MWHTRDGLFAGLPSPVPMVRYHSLVVALPLPEALQLTAWTDDGLVMALQHRDKPIFGVQFHPESICSEYGEALMHNFLKHQAMAKRLHYRVIEGELDAEAVFRQLFYRQGASFWLDSARIDAGYSRFSFMGITGCCGGRLLRYRLGQGVEVCDGVQSRLVTQDIFGFLEQALADDSIIDSTELPFDFAGGFVGYFGYERMALTAGVTGKPSRHPDACWIEADSFLAIDHLEQRSYLVYIDADLLVVTAWLDEMTARSHGNIDRRYGQTGGTGN